MEAPWVTSCDPESTGFEAVWGWFVQICPNLDEAEQSRFNSVVQDLVSVYDSILLGTTDGLLRWWNKIKFSSGCSMEGTSEQPCILVQCDGHHLVALEGARCQLKQQPHIHYYETYQTVCRSAWLNCGLAQRNCNTGPQVKFRVADMNLLSCAIFCSCGTFWGSSTACRTCKVVKLIAFKWLRSSN